MRKYRFCLLLVTVIGLWLSGSAQPSASWEGLVGLFTQPTAETFAPGEVALTYSELRFGQENRPQQSMNIWFTSSATATLTPHWEISITTRNEEYEVFEQNTLNPTLSVMDARWIGDVKYIITPPSGGKTGIAVGIQDITNATDKIDDIVTDRGRRFFVVGSYRWAHLGVTDDQQGLGVFAGADLSIADNINVIAEWVSRPNFAGILPQPSNNVNFNLGIRFIPRNVSGLRIDIAGIGDGQFNFGFSMSYRFKP